MMQLLRETERRARARESGRDCAHSARPLGPVERKKAPSSSSLSCLARDYLWRVRWIESRVRIYLSEARERESGKIKKQRESLEMRKRLLESMPRVFRAQAAARKNGGTRRRAPCGANMVSLPSFPASPTRLIARKQTAPAFLVADGATAFSRVCDARALLVNLATRLLGRDDEIMLQVHSTFE
jgi:hypothetical protein